MSSPFGCYARDVNDAPPTRHGDVLLTVWIVVGATVLLVLSLSESLRMPPLALAAIGALSAGYGEAVARALRPHVRFTETAVAIVIAFLLLPHVARFGAASLDRDAIVTMVIGTPLGLAAAWQMRRWNGRSGNFPETVAAVFIIAAAVALAIVAIVALDVLPRRHTLEVGFLLLAIAGGTTFGGLVAGARPGHLVLGAMIVLLAPRLISMGVLRLMPMYEVCVWTGALATGGTLGCLVGAWLRKRALARAAGATNLPAARIHEPPN